MSFYIRHECFDKIKNKIGWISNVLLVSFWTEMSVEKYLDKLFKHYLTSDSKNQEVHTSSFPSTWYIGKPMLVMIYQRWLTNIC